MITPRRLILTGLLCFLGVFLFSGATALVAVSQEPWAEDLARSMFIALIYIRFYFRWLGLILVVFGSLWAVILYFKNAKAFNE